MLVDLPDDVLFVIAAFLSVGDIIHLKQVRYWIPDAMLRQAAEVRRKTCRLMFYIMNDRFVWHQVVLDLVSQVPNPSVLRKLSSATASELRGDAVKYFKAEEAWEGLSLDRSVGLRVLDVCALEIGVLDTILVPGGEYIIALARDGFIYLLSIRKQWETLRYVAPSCTPDLTGARLRITPSTRYGLVLEAVVEHEQHSYGCSRQSLWLFQLDTMTPNIVPFRVIPGGESTRFLCVCEDSFVSSWPDWDSKCEMLAFGKISDSSMVTQCYLSYGDFNGEICALEMLNENILLALTSDCISAYRIPPFSLFPPDNNPVALERIWTTSFDVQHSLVSPTFLPRHDPVFGRCVDIAAQGRIATVRTASRREPCHIEFRANFGLQGDVHVSMGARRAVAVEYAENLGVFTLSTRSFSPADDELSASLRLACGRVSHSEFSQPKGRAATDPKRSSPLWLRTPYVVHSAAFDEWSGRVLVRLFDADSSTLSSCVLIVDV